MQAKDIPYGYCQCDCGRKTTIATRNDARAGVVKGEPRRFVMGHGGNRGNRLGGGGKPRKYAIAHETIDWGHGTSCWRWLGYMMDNGYGSLKVGGQNFLAHRYYYTQAKGPIAEGLEIDHLCGNRGCVNPEHLEAVTHLENVRRSRTAKLTPEHVVEIRRRDGYFGINRDLAAEFAVDPSTISVIRAGKSYQLA